MENHNEDLIDYEPSSFGDLKIHLIGSTTYAIIEKRIYDVENTIKKLNENDRYYDERLAKARSLLISLNYCKSLLGANYSYNQIKKDFMRMKKKIESDRLNQIQIY